MDTVQAGLIAGFTFLSFVPTRRVHPRGVGSPFTELTHIDFFGNQLTGTIPKELGALNKLAFLSLAFNKLTGPFPLELTEITSLVRLHLPHNQLGGKIPKELSNLRALEFLGLKDNGLTGPIPPELGELAALLYFHLDQNRLRAGPIPPELGNLVALQHLHLGKNQLRGAIPAELGKLVVLQQLYLSDNQLSGFIPPELERLVELRQLMLHANQLSGPIPPQLGNLMGLQALNLSGNKLTGSIPPELGALRCLKSLWLSNNQLRGHVPGELGALSELTQLHLEENKLEGLGEAEDAVLLVERLGKGLQLRSNPWTMRPEPVVEVGLSAVMKYLLDVREAKKAGADVTTLRLLKVVLVGSASAGKTSLMRSIVAGHGSPMKGTPAEASTVGIELLRHKLQDTSIEFFDCAGQVDYSGMHQTFLTQRALYLLVFDVTKYRDLDDAESFDKVMDEDIMRWLYTLSLRAPHSTVMLVASKCDGAVVESAQIAARVETHGRNSLERWHAKRRSDSQNNARLTCVSLIKGVSCVTCLGNNSFEKSGLKALIGRVAKHWSTSIVVPPSWDLALKVFDALRDGRDPKGVAKDYLRLDGVAASVDGEGMKGESFLTRGELYGRWNDVVEGVRGDAEAIGEALAASDKDSAFEGALWISDFAGHTLRIDGGEGIFLDVVWLSKVLKPILNHKLEDETLDNDLSPMRDDLVENGLLRWQFARYLWRDFIGHTALRSREVVVMTALFGVLIDLGVTLPLKRTALPTNANVTAPTVWGNNGGPPDMLVIMRLPDTCSDSQRRRIVGISAGILQGDQELTFKWRFGFAGPPHGLVERLVASCHVLGEVERSSCWKYGGVFKSGAITSKAGRTARLYTFALGYDNQTKVLTARIFGPLQCDRVWRVARFVASAMVNLSKDWPGVWWEGWTECAQPNPCRLYLVSSSKARVGDLLLPSPYTRRGGCDCLLESSTVSSLIVEKLGAVIDTRKDPFEGLPSEWDRSSVDSFEGLTEERDFVTSNCCVSEQYNRWLPHASVTAKRLSTLATSLFFGAVVVGIVEDEDTLWKACLVAACLLMVVALVASVLAYRFKSHDAPSEQGQIGGQHEMPADVVAAFE